MNTRGFGTAGIVAIVAALLVIGATVYFNFRPEGEIMMNKGEAMVKDGSDMMDKGNTMVEEGSDMMDKGEGMMHATSTMMNEYTGEVLAGSTSPLLDYTEADYKKAIASDKLVVLYFYANWCPDCKAEFPRMQKAFNELTGSDVIGFRVNYNDSDTDASEVALAREFGVAYQHTKVFVKKGTRTLKSPEAWDTTRYISEIHTALTK